MVVALVLGRGGSVGFPNKNVYPVMGRAMMEYAILAALHTEEIDEIYVSTDSDEIKTIARKHGVYIIDRPDYLCTKEALHQDAMVHGYHYIKDLGKDIDLIVLMQCNAPFILPEQLREGIRVLREKEDLDSAATVSKYNMFSPTRARKIGQDGLIYSFIPLESVYDLDKINCDKDSQGDVFFTDGTFIVRPRCLEKLEDGMLPYQWMGKKSYPIMNWAGLDVDFSWQVPQVEAWLKESGFTKDTLPYERSRHV